jgi:hypothetical protein
MADLKPIGSEKLNIDDKLKRILELTYYGNKQNTTSSHSSTSKVERLSESSNGVFGIVKEKDGYYVKKGLTENSLDYIGGLFMKNKNRFSSYADADKRMNLLSSSELNEATKYVLKQNKPESEPMPPANDMGTEMPPMDSEQPMDAPLPSDEMGNEMPPSDEMGGEMPPSDEMGGEAKPSDYMTEIQKFSGKLGQELRDQKSKMESDDIKYVLNMIISAVDLDKLEDDDIEEIGKKFDREAEEDADSDVETPDVPADDETSPSEPTGDEELGETMDRLESFLNMPAVQDEEVDLSKYSNLGMSNEEDITKELDLDEIKNEINKSISETLGKYFK